MKQISLTQNKVALVDDYWFDFLNQWKWSASENGNTYNAVKGVWMGNKQILVRMHHIIMGFPLKGDDIDHKDGNGLNNQRDNLRHVTHRVNTGNKNIRREGLTSSKYVGVTENKDRGKKWRVRIRFGKKKLSLGCFDDEKEAQDIYQEALYRIENNLPLIGLVKTIKMWQHLL